MAPCNFFVSSIVAKSTFATFNSFPSWASLLHIPFTFHTAILNSLPHLFFNTAFSRRRGISPAPIAGFSLSPSAFCYNLTATLPGGHATVSLTQCSWSRSRVYWYSCQMALHGIYEVHLPTTVNFRWPYQSLTLIRYLCRNMEVLHHVVATFIFVLQEAHFLNMAVIHFLENSCNTLITCGSIRLLPNAPHHRLTENRCWKLHCATSCGFFSAQGCEFLVLVLPYHYGQTEPLLCTEVR